MKKKILKTSLITVIIMLAIYLIAWGITCLVYPVGLAKIHEGVNDYKGACKYYEIDYKRNPTLSKLEKLTECSYLAKEHKKVVKYGEKLIDDEDFNSTLKNEFYADVCCFIIGSKYALGHEDTVERAVEYAFVIENETVVDFNDACLNLLIIKADDEQDEQTLRDLEFLMQSMQADMSEADESITLKITDKINTLQLILEQYQPS